MNVAIVTGAAGDIGRAICSTMSAQGYRTIGVDLPGTESVADAHIEMDLRRLCDSELDANQYLAPLSEAVGDESLHALINNAAVQIVGPFGTLTASDWMKTLEVNVVAPTVLIRSLLPLLVAAGGSVVNIGSVHATLTKSGFSAYAASKAAMSALTRSLAVELGGEVRVNAVLPAAIHTRMLKEGFEGNAQGLTALRTFHPTGEIGSPEDVARVVAFLADRRNVFLNGALVGLDGGIGGRLHDPARVRLLRWTRYD
jgi:NAD(P)-dependent dehydrogenase (short-subunit alcohol dehydrogenase family)